MSKKPRTVMPHAEHARASFAIVYAYMAAASSENSAFVSCERCSSTAARSEMGRARASMHTALWASG